jgi:thioredoxin 1
MSNKKKLKFKDIINSKKPVLVDFYATWCGPCQALSPIIGEVKKQLGTKMKVIKIDVDKKKSISNKYKIRTLPTLAIFQNGEILWRASGMKTKTELLGITSQFIKNTPTTTDEKVSEPVQKTSWFGKLFKK